MYICGICSSHRSLLIMFDWVFDTMEAIVNFFQHLLFWLREGWGSSEDGWFFIWGRFNSSWWKVCKANWNSVLYWPSMQITKLKQSFYCQWLGRWKKKERAKCPLKNCFWVNMIIYLFINFFIFGFTFV